MKKWMMVILMVSTAGGYDLHGQAQVIGQWDILANEMLPLTNGVTQWVSSPQGVTLGFWNEDWEVEADILRNTGGAENFGLWAESETTTGETIRGGVMVIKTDVLRVRSALFTGGHVVRLANDPDGGGDGYFDTVGPAENVRVWVNGKEDEPLQAETWQIVSFIFPSETPFENAMIFGDPGLPSWKRGFEGEAKGVVLLGSGEVSEAALRGMEHALALRFKIKGIKPADAAERDAAWGTGFNAHGAWRTLFLLK